MPEWWFHKVTRTDIQLESCGGREKHEMLLSETVKDVNIILISPSHALCSIYGRFHSTGPI